MIEATDLVKNYRTRGAPPVRALDGLGFAVAPGTVFGLLGPNGAGKSTTVKILTTLSRPDSGAATVAGYDVIRQPERVRRAIGVVGQRSGADPDATGRENLLLQGRVFGLSAREASARAGDLLGLFGLADAADRLVRTYSGGMRRKLDVGLGLVARPTVLFLDEPTTGLDPEARADMWAEIGGLAADGLTILLTTHYLEEADRLAARLAIVDRGKVVVEGTPDELKGELAGDTVTVELATEADNLALRVPAALARVPGVSEVVVEGRAVRARAAHGATALPAVLAALEDASLQVRSAGLARPSLDDVYLRYAGRSFTDVPEREVA